MRDRAESFARSNTPKYRWEGSVADNRRSMFYDRKRTLDDTDPKTGRSREDSSRISMFHKKPSFREESTAAKAGGVNTTFEVVGGLNASGFFDEQFRKKVTDNA